jgi:anti-anti-sigma factor
MSEVIRDGEETTIIPEGDIVADEVNQLQNIVAEQQENCRMMTIDFKNVTIIDSSGIAVLIGVQNNLSSNDGILKIINVNDDIYMMFEIMRLSQHFSITKA